MAEEERTGKRKPDQRFALQAEIFEIVGILAGVPYYRCKRLDPITFRCMDYADRPPICQRYGTQEIPCQHPDCSGPGEGPGVCNCFRLSDLHRQAIESQEKEPGSNG
jgi:hypothetical protein